MAQSNLELVRRHIDARNRRDLEAVLATFAPDVEIDFSRSRSPYAGIYRGHDGWRELWDLTAAAWAEQRIEAEEILDVDGQVVVIGRMHTRGAESAAAAVAHGAVMFEMRGGLIARYEVHQDPADAVAAARAAQG